MLGYSRQSTSPACQYSLAVKLTVFWLDHGFPWRIKYSPSSFLEYVAPTLEPFQASIFNSLDILSIREHIASSTLLFPEFTIIPMTIPMILCSPLISAITAEPLSPSATGKYISLAPSLALKVKQLFTSIKVGTFWSLYVKFALRDADDGFNFTFPSPFAPVVFPEDSNSEEVSLMTASISDVDAKEGAEVTVFNPSCCQDIEGDTVFSSNAINAASHSFFKLEPKLFFKGLYFLTTPILLPDLFVAVGCGVGMGVDVGEGGAVVASGVGWGVALASGVGAIGCTTSWPAGR